MPFAFATDKAYLMAATKIAAGSITQDMQVTKWGMSVIKPGELRLTLYPSNLVSAAYADLGALICKRVEFKEYPDMAVCSGTRPVGSGNMTKRTPQGLGSADMRARSPNTGDIVLPLNRKIGSNAAAIDASTHPDA